MTESVEVERKYDVDDAAAVPVLVAFEVVDLPAVTLRAVYYDTDAGELARHRITLRRREGGHDAGWHLKLPAAEGRLEVTAPLADELPDELAERIRELADDRPIAPIVRLTTLRSPWIISTADGDRIAELADDRVTAIELSTAVERAWREWEVELLPGAGATPDARSAVLDAIEPQLVAAGARPSSSASKLARALGRDSLGA